MVNPTYFGLSPTKLLHVRLKVPHQKRGYFFKKKEQKYEVTTDVTLRCGHDVVSSRQLKVMPSIRKEVELKSGRQRYILHRKSRRKNADVGT